MMMSAIRLTSKITLFFFLLQCLIVPPANGLLLPPRDASETAHKGVLQALRVSPWTGTLSFSEKDIPISDPIFPLEVTRTYTTDLAGANGDFGHGWTWEYGVRLLFDRKQIVYQDESGNAFLFRTVDKVVFRCPDLSGHTLIKKGASFIYTLPSGQERLFDASGALTRMNDLRGNSLKIERADSRIIRISGSTGRWLKLVWSGNLIRGIEDSTGRKSAYRYDLHGRLAETVRFDNAKVSYWYDEKNRVTRIIYADGRSAEINYDEMSGRVTRLKSGPVHVSYRSEGLKNTVLYGDDEQWVFEKDASGGRRKITGPWGGVWEMLYKDGRLVSKTNPHGGITKYAYDQNGLLKSVTNPMDRTTQYVYHKKWPLPIEVRYPGGEVEHYAYDEKGSITGFTDKAGRKAAISYYPNGLVKNLKDVDGTESGYKYDAFGLPTAVTNSTGNFSQLVYDTRGNLRRHTDPSGVSTEIEYTPSDLPARVLQGGIVQMTAEYDAARAVVGLREAGTASYQMIYDPSRNISIAGTSGDMTASYKRDSFGNILEANISGRGSARFMYRNGSLVQAADASGGVWHYTYDKAGKLASQQDPSGNLTRFIYNSSGYLAEKEYSDGQTIRYTYDSADRIIGASNGKEKTSILYDAAGRPVSEQTSGMPAVRAVFEKSGKDFTLHIGDTQVKYTHNADGKLLKAAVAHGPAITFLYDAAGKTKELNYSNGTKTSYDYDKSGRVVHIAQQKENQTLSGRAYDWDPSGKVSRIEYLPAGTRSTLRYDADSRLASIDGTGRMSVSYLQGGLRKNFQEGGSEDVQSRYDASWRLSEAGKARYSYDAAGNRTSRQDERGITSYAYNTENSLASVKMPDGREIRYGYDAFGRRSSIEKNGSVERLVYFGSSVVATADANGSIRRVFVPTAALDFPLFAQIEKEWYAFHQDINASIIAMTDSQGKIALEAEYSAFGVPMKESAIANPFGFAGMWYEKETGIYHCRAREYDPATGVFLQPDPFPGEVYRPDTQMLYAFAHNNPVTNRDPEGRLLPLVIGAALIGIAVTAIIVYPFVQTMGQNARATNRVSSGDISDETLDRSQRVRENINTTARAAEKGGDMPTDPEGAVITGIQKVKEKYDEYRSTPSGTPPPPPQAPVNSDEAQEARQRAEAADQQRREADEKARAAQAQREAERLARDEARRQQDERRQAEDERRRAEREAAERAEWLRKEEERIRRELADLQKLKEDGYIGGDIDEDAARKQRELDANRRQQQQQTRGQGTGTGGYNPLQDPNLTSKGPGKRDKVDISKVDKLGGDFQQTSRGDKGDKGTRDQQQPPQVIQQPGTYTDGSSSTKGDTSGTDQTYVYPPYGPDTDSRGQKGTDWTKWAGDRKPPKDNTKTPPTSTTTTTPPTTTTTTPATTKGIEVTVVGTAPPGKCIIVQGQLVPVKGYKENIAGMTVTLTGPVNQSATSSGGGGFSFKEIPAGDYVISVTQWDYGMTKQSLTAPSGKSIKIVLKGSCPYLYVWDGKSFIKENDIYSVARITPSDILQTEDLLTADSSGIALRQVSLDNIPDKLRKERSYADYYKISSDAKSEDENYRLKIVEQASEHSYTDFVELLALDHTEGTTAGITRDGKPFLYKTLLPVESFKDLNGKASSTGRAIDLYNEDGIEVQLPHEAFSSGILAVNWQGFLDGQEQGHTASQGRPKLSLQRKDPNGTWQTLDWVYPRDEMQQTYFLMDNKPEGWDKDGKVRLVASSCVSEKHHRIEGIQWGQATTDNLSLSSLPLVSARASASADVLKKVQSSDGESAHLGPGEEVSLVFKSRPLDKGLQRTLIFVSEGFYVPLPMIRLAGN